MPAFLLGLLKGAFSSFFLNLLGVAFTERYVAALFFWLGGELVRSTKNGLDDKILADVKNAYYASKHEVDPAADKE